MLILLSYLNTSRRDVYLHEINPNVSLKQKGARKKNEEMHVQMLSRSTIAMITSCGSIRNWNAILASRTAILLQQTSRTLYSIYMGIQTRRDAILASCTAILLQQTPRTLCSIYMGIQTRRDLALCKMYEHALSTSGRNCRQIEFDFPKVWFMRKLRGDWILVMLATIRSRTFCLLVCYQKT
jgi:hypothetical protein